MSDGGRENKREHEKNRLRHVRKSGGDEYAKATAKVAVAQVCENEGFQTFQQPVLDALSDVTTRYIGHIGRTALLYANSAGRTEANHFDIIQGLEDLSPMQGFAGASEIDHCLARSGLVLEILQYVSDPEEVPFAYDLRRFPVDRERKQPQSFLQIGEEAPEEHIPGWLPTFPDPKTYNLLRKELAEVQGASAYEVNVQFAKHQDMNQNHLTHLFSSNGLPGPSSADTGNPAKPNEAVPLNPYLSVPVIVEKEVSPAATLLEKPSREAVEGDAWQMNQNADSNVLAAKTIAPANVVANRKSTSPSELSSQRTPVQFKIKIGKKALVSGGMRSDRIMDENSQCSIGKCNENSDAKERANKILKESMESPQDQPKQRAVIGGSIS